MGRRSRKRASSRPPEPGGRSAPAAPATTAPRRRSRRGEPPPAPWGSFPLAELSVLLALVLGIVGLVTWGRSGQLLLGCATVLGSLAGLELSVREHFAGYRSHTTLLAGTAAVLSLAVLFFSRAPYGLLLVVGASVFGTAFWLLRRTFARRSGGLTFR